jgi:malonyl-CoA O-methyltransferase
LSERSKAADIDPRTVRRRFERAAATYARSSRLESEVATRMLERLDYVKIAPRRVLDAGSGPPRRELARRYPKADVVALDFALPMLRATRAGWFRRHAILLCSDMARLPLAAGAFELVWSNMALHWLADPLPAFRESARVLAPEGLLMFSTLGPDTLKELRAAAGAERVHKFIDMHDLGDMLVAAGFAAPVVDMEMIEVDYRESENLLSDLRASGQTSARVDRRRGLGGRALRERLRTALPGRATFEVVYGHAWKGRKADPEVKSVRVFKRMP